MSTQQEKQDLHYFIRYIRVFRDLDIKSKIVASIVISLITISCNWFVNLCGYLYWRSFFSRFKIPFKYINEAIIPRNDMKYIIVLMIPPIILLWLFLSACLQKLKPFLNPFFKKISIHVLKKNSIIVKLLIFIFTLGVIFFLLIVGIEIADEWKWLVVSAVRRTVFYVLFLEVIAFLGYHLFRFVLQNYHHLEQRKWKQWIIINGIVAIYLVLSIVYVFGALSNNYPKNWYQTITIVADDDYESLLNNNEETSVRIVLFETADYYYVVDALARGKDNININKLDYTFVEKKQCPIARILVKSLMVFPSSNDQIDFNRLASVQFCITCCFFVYLIIFLAYPHQEKSLD